MRLRLLGGLVVAMLVTTTGAEPPRPQTFQSYSESIIQLHASTDLNGDGRSEEISLTPLTRRGGRAFTLTVNGSSVTDKLGDQVDGFLIVDIDENDRYKEVAVHTPGPSDDDEYFYFWYNGKELHRSGKVARWPSLLGHGIVLVKDWHGFWARTKKYVLTAGHTLKLLPQEFYWVGVEGPARKGFPIYSTRDADRVQANVRPGSKVLVVLCDCRGSYQQWQYLLKTEHGQLGWVQAPLYRKLDLPAAD